MANCKFPLCVRIAGENGLCIPHRIYKDSGIPDPKPVKAEPEKVVVKKKGISKKSAKQKDIEKELKKMYLKEVILHQDCQIHSPVCIKKFQGWHHKQKKSPSNATDRKKLLRSCNPCNSYMEANTAWAEDNGFIISKYSKA